MLNTLQEIEGVWKVWAIRVESNEHPSSPILLITPSSWRVGYTLLKEHLSSLESIKRCKTLQTARIQRRVDFQISQLEGLEMVFPIWQGVQQSYTRLSAIFSNRYLCAREPKMSRKYEEFDRTFRELVKSAQGAQHVTECLRSPKFMLFLQSSQML